MKTTRRWAAWSGVLSAALAAACGGHSEPELPGEVELRSQHFVFHAFEDDPDVCPGLLDRMERHFEVIRAATGFPWPEGRVIHYYKYRDYHDIVDAHLCPYDRGACVLEGVVHSPDAFHLHELIHAYFFPLGSPPPLFSEGLASVLVCEYGYEFFVPPFEWDDPAQERSYQAGQLLLSELLPTYGWEPFLQLYAGPWERGDRAEIERRFEAIYGVSIDEEWAKAKAATDPLSACSVAWECAGPALAPGETAQVVDQCEDEPLRSLVIDEPQLLDLRGTGTVVLHECPQDPSQLIGGAWQFLAPRTYAELPPGSYFLRAIDEASLTSRRLEGSMLGTDCDQLTPVPLDAPNPGTGWLFQPLASPYYLRLAPSQSTRLSILAPELGSFEVCATCADTSCVSATDSTQIETSSEVVLRFPPGVPAAGLQQILVSAE